MASSSAYQVVAIMGPQSSGKSTLVNHVVGVVWSAALRACTHAHRHVRVCPTLMLARCMQAHT